MEVSDFAGVCEQTATRHLRPDTKYLSFVYDAAGPLPKVGTYTLTSPGPADWNIRAWGARSDCTGYAEPAETGTFTIVRADACGIVIDFDLDFGYDPVDHVSGTISAPGCSHFAEWALACP